VDDLLVQVMCAEACSGFLFLISVMSVNNICVGINESDASV
jgi:hypothetical protein